MKLEVSAVIGEGEVVGPEHMKVAARLLRNIADRVEAGDDLGGFYFSETDFHDGGFAIFPDTSS